MSMAVDQMTWPLSRTVQALEGIARLDEPLLQAELERDLGGRYLTDPPTARHHLEHALQLYVEMGDAVGEANTYRNLSDPLLHSDGDLGTPVKYALLSIDAARRSGRGDALGISLGTASVTLGNAQHWQESLDLGREALAVLQNEGITYFQPIVLQGIALAYNGLGDSENAIAAVEEALAQLTTGTDQAIIAILWSAMAVAALASGDHARAREACKRFDEAQEVVATIDDGRYLQGPEYQRHVRDVERVRSALTHT